MDEDKNMKEIENTFCSEKDEMYMFIVRDYTTQLVGRFNKKGDFFYTQRGDGQINKYYSYRVLTYKKLKY
jgi:hypothetical protein